jgi:hypothetical protein
MDLVEAESPSSLPTKRYAATPATAIIKNKNKALGLNESALHESLLTEVG